MSGGCRRLAPALGVLLLVCGAFGQSARSGAHGWLVRPPDEAGADVVHLPPRGAGTLDAPPGSGRLVMRLPVVPERVATGGTSLYLLEGARGDHRAVLQIEAVPTRAGWSFDPPGRARSLALLPAAREVEGFAATQAGPVVLLRDASGLRSMRRWGRSGWEPLATPWASNGSSSSESQRVFLAASESVIYVLGDAGGTGSGVLWEFRETSDAWHRRGTAPMPEGIESLLCVGDLVVAVGRVDGVVELSAIRPPFADRIVGLEGFENGPVVTPVGDHIFVLALPAQSESLDERALVAEYTALGRELYRGELQQPGLVSGNELRLYALFMSLSVAFIAVTIFRPEQSREIALPEGTVLAGVGQRAVAMVLDGVIGLVLASLLTTAMVAAGVEGGVAWVLPLATLLSALHTWLTEWLLGASAGKLVTGCRVTSESGDPLTMRAALLRNLIRWIVLPLVLFALGDPKRRHPGDVAAGSVVVRRRGRGDSDDSERPAE